MRVYCSNKNKMCKTDYEYYKSLMLIFNNMYNKALNLKVKNASVFN
jgi:hypothetical protein